MKRHTLDKEEQEDLDAFEGGEFESALTPERRDQLATIARDTFKKDQRINIRLSAHDLDGLKRRALAEGIPYQTLVSSILHKYVSGSLYDVNAGK